MLLVPYVASEKEKKKKVKILSSVKILNEKDYSIT